MRSLFSWNLFKKFLDEELSSLELRFIGTSFKKASLYLSTLSIVFAALLGSSSRYLRDFDLDRYFYPLLGTVASISGICLFVYFLPKYRMDAQLLESRFTRKAFFILSLTFCSLVLIFLKLLLKKDGETPRTNIFASLLLLGGWALAYFIPYSISASLTKREILFNLRRLVESSLKLYGLLFAAVFLFVLITSKTKWYALLILLTGSLVSFSSPFLSLYRLKLRTRRIDATDELAVRKEGIFSIFEIGAQLLQMPIYLFKGACLWVAYGCPVYRR
ncbi:hypothetical protein MHLP_03585 [Candidatus Mycoplasma haematolamae str. Purdue]|uniref:Uncharacterized protein n=1 Tax=Mycoplasma haematolamae (strain Purdue) TaxID=1212765 RepID=I7C6X1_MYCHA|nr:hypothetical protein [Candidatus Mycoplasma haematolamae]AFO52297.1 hypothetical protein MHLP_03585 [Candidatus Mycoplasma haematolamae str. Purdue]